MTTPERDHLPDMPDYPPDVAEMLAACTVVLHPDDAADLAGTLRHAGALLGQLAGEPAAEAAHRELAGPDAVDLAAFALDLLVRAAELSHLAGTDEDPP